MRGAVCTICTELFDSSHDVSALKCGHVFHADCLNPWLSQSMTCPQCRLKVTKAAIIQKLFFSRPDADDSVIGGTSPSRELAQVTARLIETQNRLCVCDRELAKLSAEKSAVNDRANQLTESYRLVIVCIAVLLLDIVFCAFF